MCFSATANFVGSGVLGAAGVVTLTKVKTGANCFSQLFPCYSPFISLWKDSSGWD